MRMKETSLTCPGFGSGSTLSIQCVSWKHVPFTHLLHEDIGTDTPSQTAFVIACCVSFRTLFLQQEQKSQQARDQLRKESGSMYALDENHKGFRAKLRWLQDSILDTCRNWEGTTATSGFGLPVPPDPRLNLDFERGTGAHNFQGISKTTAITVSHSSATHSQSYSDTIVEGNYI